MAVVDGLQVEKDSWASIVSKGVNRVAEANRSLVADIRPSRLTGFCYPAQSC